MDLAFPLPKRMIEQAKRFAASDEEPAEARLASTVVLMKPATTGFEVFAIRRVTTMAFAADMYAFPGGSVDPHDFTVASLGDRSTVTVASLGDRSTVTVASLGDTSIAAAELDWAGPPPADWAVRLGLGEPEARAVLCAAVREVFEESGVLLAGPDPDTVVSDVSGDDWEAARVALIDRSIGFAEMLTERGLVLRTDLLAPWSRWVTPEFEPRRYDTYFFVAVLPAGQRTRDVGGEAAHSVWAETGDLVDDSLPMLPPTRSTLRQLGQYPTIAAVLAAAAMRDAAAPVRPRIDLEEGTLIIPG